MKVEPISNGCLRVWMADDEMKEWGLTDPEEEPRRVRRLLRKVLSAAGWRLGKPLSAEMIPVEGGCVLLVTPLLHPRGDEPAVYHLADGDALLDLIRQWRYIGEDPQPHCSLYQCPQGYGLVVYPDVPLTRRQQHLLLEYGSLWGCGEGAAAHCGEFGTLLRAGWTLTEPAPRPQDGGDPPH